MERDGRYLKSRKKQSSRRSCARTFTHVRNVPYAGACNETARYATHKSRDNVICRGRVIDIVNMTHLAENTIDMLMSGQCVCVTLNLSVLELCKFCGTY